MELKPGYKLTDVGVIPMDWRVEYLERCVRPGAPICYGILMPGEHCDRGVPVVKVRDIFDGRIDESNLLLTQPSIDDAYKRSRLRDGDVLITIRGTTGRVAVVPKELDSANITQDTARVRVNLSESNQFVYYVLQSQVVQHQVALHTIGQAVKGINIRDVKSLFIPLPEKLAEQRAIAGALSDVDALIGALDQLLAKKRDLKQAAMQQLLTGHQRLPGFAPANPRFQQTDIGLIPDDWEASTVGREFDIQLGKMLDAEKNTGVLKPYLGNRAVQWDRIDTSELPMIAMSKLDLERFRLKQGDLLVCEGGDVGRAAVWDSPLEECYFQKALHRLRPRRGFNSRLMIAFLRLMSARGQLLNYVTQTSIAHLPKDKFVTVPLPMPPAAEQTAIAEVLSDMDAELAALEQKRDKTRLLKQGMMQELLTGRTRLI